MPDNDIVIQGKNVAFTDRNGVRYSNNIDAPAVTATVLVAAVTASSSQAFAADTSTRRQLAIKNIGTTVVEVSPVSGFAFGAGFPIDPTETLAMNYSGAIYARVSSGTGSLRAWSEH